MSQQTNEQVTESAFPIGLVMVPMILGSLIWVCVLLARSGAF